MDSRVNPSCFNCYLKIVTIKVVYFIKISKDFTDSHRKSSLHVSIVFWSLDLSQVPPSINHWYFLPTRQNILIRFFLNNSTQQAALFECRLSYEVIDYTVCSIWIQYNQPSLSPKHENGSICLYWYNYILAWPSLFFIHVLMFLVSIHYLWWEVFPQIISMNCLTKKSSKWVSNSLHITLPFKFGNNGIYIYIFLCFWKKSLMFTNCAFNWLKIQ